VELCQFISSSAMSLYGLLQRLGCLICLLIWYNIVAYGNLLCAINQRLLGGQEESTYPYLCTQGRFL
jgi:hypothetical protein